MTSFCPLTTTGAEELVVQTIETMFVVDRKVNPVALVGHVKITNVPEEITVSFGGMKRLNTVPLPELPPKGAVP